MSETAAVEKAEYKGWKLFDKVIICAKPWEHWVGNSYVNDGMLQGYVVEPGNKKQLESAKNWADYTEYGPYDWNTGKYEWKKEHPAQVYEFDNSEFTLELLNSAGGSSQGGKLSFWNCKITKDDKTFIIGIAADLLLAVLKTNTIINGVVQAPLMFARYRGGVGMLSTAMEEYKEAVSDMQIKATMKTGKTSKHKIGKVYGTATLSNIYAGDFYIWYEPVYEVKKSAGYWCNSYNREELVGFRKLKKPKVVKYFPGYLNGKTKLSDYGDTINVWRLENKLPKRVELPIDVDIDISKDTLVANFLKENITDRYNQYLDEISKGNRRYFIPLQPAYLGISANADSYELPDNIKQILKATRYVLYDEENNRID